MGVTLGLIAVLCALVGVGANRCNVFILAPLIGGMLALAVFIGFARGESVGTIAAALAIAVACLQAGYVGPLIITALTAGEEARPRVPASVDADVRARALVKVYGPHREPVLLAELTYLPSPANQIVDAAEDRRRLHRRAAGA
jgi:hypothetical protein